MPWFMIALFMICLILFLGAVLVLYVLPKGKHADKIPSWATQAAYPAVMLCLPVVLLMITMMMFPCFWQQCP